MILVIDNYDSFTYNIVQYLYELGFDSKVYRNDKITISELDKMHFTHIIISPGPKTPSEAGISKEVISYFQGKIPILGVCLGHQAITEVFGGKVINAKSLVHGKTSVIYHDSKTIFSSLPSPIEVARYHSLAASRENFPDCLEVSAYTDDGEIMALRHKFLPIEGVQFHPESILTKYGKSMLKNFIIGNKKGILFKDILNKIISGNDLTLTEAKDSMDMIMSGELTDSQIASFLTALNIKGESIDEITGFVLSLREQVEPIDLLGYDVVDTCGTGGDSKGTFNISTAASIVASSCGVMIAKHGNRGVSSTSGSSDVLQQLGIKIDIDKKSVRDNIINHGMGFMFAPYYHKAMKHVVNVRKDLGIRTVFNILGPLVNPSSVSSQIIGVYSQDIMEKIALVLGNLGSKKVFVVSSDDGLDEISLFAKTKVIRYFDGNISTYWINPVDYGFVYSSSDIEGIKAKNSLDSARIILDVFHGNKGVSRDIIILNTAIILELSGVCINFKDGINLASNAIDSGKALKKLNELREN